MKTKPKTKRKISRKKFLAFVDAVYNTSAASPQGDTGPDRFRKGLRKASRSLLDVAKNDPDRLNGVRAAARLFLEATSAEDANEYMDAEATAAVLGNRQGRDNASIVVTVTPMSTSIKLIPNP